MGQHLATLLAAAALSGCSLIYNPSNLPDKGNMPPDAAISDANPALLRLDEVKSPTLLEGAGQDGSAPQILVVYGEHITKSATLTVTPMQNPMGAVVINVSDVSIADDGNSIAALVRAGYMDTVDETGPNATGPIPLIITVAQTGAATQTKAWELKPLDELGTGMADAPAPGKKFSRVEAADITFRPKSAGNANRAIVHAVGRINITGRVSANANLRAGGAGGCDGGDINAAGECFGGGKALGGGGGFAQAGENGNSNTGGAMSGDPLIKIYEGTGAAMNRGGGGGAGDENSLGGGGGGTIELTAGGNLSVTTLEAKGAAGGNALLRGAGGGSGGAVVLRAGGMLVAPATVDLSGGDGGNGGLGGAPGGKGSVGRWRFDAAKLVGTLPAPAPRRGPMIVRPMNPIFETKEPTMMLTGESGVQVTIITQYDDDTSNTETETLIGETSSFAPTLKIGINKVCVLVPGGSIANDEATNCVEVAFIP